MRPLHFQTRRLELVSSEREPRFNGNRDTLGRLFGGDPASLADLVHSFETGDEDIAVLAVPLDRLDTKRLLEDRTCF